MNDKSYAVEAPDAIRPVGKGAEIVLRYAENGLGAGIAYKGPYKIVVWGFPFESIREEQARDLLMEKILNFFNAD